MRKNIKFFIALAAVLTAIFFADTSCAYAQDSTAIPFTLPDGTSKEFYETQAKSIIQYNQLLNQLSLEN